MKYQSTRSTYTVNDIEAVLEGIAKDGGLYLYPDLDMLDFDWQSCLKKDSLGMSSQILHALLPGYGDMDGLVKRAYRNKFETEDLTPLVKVGDNYVLELFRGPTSAFKDVALSVLPHLITEGKKELGRTDRTLILTATSGDTGKAALEGFHDVAGTEIIVFFPDGGVSPVQKAQMVTQEGRNVHVFAVKGNFDDCQTGVKRAFAAFAEKDSKYSRILSAANAELSSANSINIGRLAPQVTYYFIAYRKLIDAGRISLGDPVDFTVPTGNFGDILAGYFAKLLGLPVGRLICASNANNVLTDFLTAGVYDKRREFFKTSSPSMDILVSSNLERLLYLVSRDADKVAAWMKALNTEGVYTLPEAYLAKIRETFSACCCSENACSATIGRIYKDFGYLADPHTAVAIYGADEYKAGHPGNTPMVVLSTASPFKFPAAVLSAVGGNTAGDEFAQMETLSRLSGLPIPKGLAGLKERTPLHEEVIAAEDICDTVAAVLRQR